MNADIVHLHGPQGQPAGAGRTEPPADAAVPDYTVLLGWLEAYLLDPEDMTRRVHRFREAARTAVPALHRIAIGGAGPRDEGAIRQLGEAAQALSADALSGLCRDAITLTREEPGNPAASRILPTIERSVAETREILAEIADGIEGGCCAVTE